MKNFKIKSFCIEFTITTINVYNKLKCKQIVNSRYKVTDFFIYRIGICRG